MFWGLSEALDLYQEYLNAHKKGEVICETSESKEELQSENDIDANVEGVEKQEEEDDKEKSKEDDKAEESKVAEAEQENNVEKDCVGKNENDKENIEDKHEKGESDTESKEGEKGEAPPLPIPKTLNVLLLGAGDPRHVIQTMAKLYTHSSKEHAAPNIHFYMLDGCVEIVARNLALLGIALEHPDSFNLLNRVHLFMDVYGNSLLRPTSHQYLMGKAKALLNMVTDSEHLIRSAPFLNLDNLKYRERDGLENAVNFWLPKEGRNFNIQEHWVLRLRQLLGIRYDYREGAFDWDLNMTLKERNAKQLCSQEYRYWRETGIAFTYPQYEQCKPNKTLAAGLVRNGETYLHRGYVGDIQTGPFCAYGLRTTDEDMNRSSHGENDFRSTDVTERNLLELFHELLTSTPYVHDKDISRRFGSVKMVMGKRLTWDECDVNNMLYFDGEWVRIEGVRVYFLSGDEVFTLQDAEGRWRNHFDVVFVGHNYFTFLKDTFAEVLRPNGLLILETKLLTVARKNEVNEFETKLKNFAKSSKLKPVLNYNALNAMNSLLKYKKIELEGSNK